VRGVAIAAFVLLLVLTTTSFWFQSPYLLSDVARLVATGACVIAAAIAGRSPLVRRTGATAWRWMERQERRSVTAAALASFAISSALARWVLEPWPHVSDEISYLFQARSFAAGTLSLAAPDMALRSFFPGEWVVMHEGRWFSVLPPGWPLLLALGVRLGVPSLVNPALGALALIVVHRVALHLTSPRRALAVAWFCVLSPFFSFMCASFMSHPAALLFTALSLWALLEATSTGQRALFLLSGCCSGFALLVRPLDAIALWIAQAGWLALRRRTWRQLTGTMISAAGVGAGAALYVTYNHALGGRWFVPLVSLTSPHNRFGFGPDVGLSWSGFSTPGHTPWRSAVNLNFNLAVLSADLFGWPISSLWPVWLLLCTGPLTRAQRGAAVSALALVCGYGLYWYSGVCFGARFYFCALPALLVLAVEGLVRAADLLGERSGLGREQARGAVASFVAACFVFSALVYVPVVAFIEPYRDHRGVDAGLARFVATQGVHHGIVFVGPKSSDFGPALLWNTADPTAGDVIYAYENGPGDDALVSRCPDRAVFHYDHRATSPPWPPGVRGVLRRGYLVDALRAVASRVRGVRDDR
jgi:hypothetical protein